MFFFHSSNQNGERTKNENNGYEEGEKKVLIVTIFLIEMSKQSILF